MVILTNAKVDTKEWRYQALLLGKLEAYSVLESMYLWLHITWITKESSQRRVLGQYMSLGRF